MTIDCPFYVLVLNQRSLDILNIFSFQSLSMFCLLHKHYILSSLLLCLVIIIVLLVSLSLSPSSCSLRERSRYGSRRRSECWCWWWEDKGWSMRHGKEGEMRLRCYLSFFLKILLLLDVFFYWRTDSDGWFVVYFGVLLFLLCVLLDCSKIARCGFIGLLKSHGSNFGQTGVVWWIWGNFVLTGFFFVPRFLYAIISWFVVLYI